MKDKNKEFYVGNKMKKDYKALNNIELEKINGGIFIVFASSQAPAFDPVPLKPE